ncbi:MAG: hypothetical protein ACYCZA_12570 [Thiobacillus sp.]
MVEYAEQVRKTYSELETEELLGRVTSGTLTEEAHRIALEELKARNVPTSELPVQALPPSSEASLEPGFFWRCWHGKERLWKAYWLLGLLGGFLFALTRIPTSPLVQGVLFLLFAIPIHMFWWVSIWRCAFHTSHWGWTVLARGVVAINLLILVIGIPTVILIPMLSGK